MFSCPEFLTIGHVTKDMCSDGSFALGGTVTFAALTASRLGLAAGMLTCGDPALEPVLRAQLPAVAVHFLTSEHTTTFANHYEEGFRTQYLYERARELSVSDLPTEWREAKILLFGPLAQEFQREMVAAFPRRPGFIRAATPQGWLRRWDADGLVHPAPWRDAAQILPLLDVLILSRDDLLPFADGDRSEADMMLQEWSLLVPLLVATEGRHGATLFRQGHALRFPAFPAHEVDPTGAGDVFAAAFLASLARYGDPERAVIFANCTASFSVARQGISSIPTLACVESCLQGLSSVCCDDL